MNKTFLFLTALLLINTACGPPPLYDPMNSAPNYSQASIQYFQEIGFGAEFERAEDQHKEKLIAKWNTPVAIQISGEYTDADYQEVEKIAKELSQLTGLSVSLTTTNSFNSKVIFTDQDYFQNHCSIYNPSLPQSGFFCLQWNDYREITSSTILIHSELRDQNIRNHLIREELTQSFGIMKDSYTYKDSIFQQDSSTSPTQYATIDKEIIRLLYDKRVQPGMNKEQFLYAINSTV